MKSLHFRPFWPAILVITGLLMFLSMLSAVWAQAPVAPNGKFIEVSGQKLYYEETGQGPPLILLHGFGRTASDWHGLTEEFSKNYRILAFDSPGHGRSDNLENTQMYLHKSAAERILRAMELLNLDSAYVFGHSGGSFIALYMSIMQPQRIKKIIVASGQLYYSQTTRKVITAQGGPGKNPMLPLERLERMHGKMKAEILANQFWNFRSQYGDPSFTPDVLSAIQAESLIIHGDNDPIAPVSNAWEMYQHFPKARLWIVPNGGHIALMGPANRQEMVKQVAAFLEGRKPNP